MIADPMTEIRMTALHATRGASYWSRQPVTRMDLDIGAYDDISSADVPPFTTQLITALPGLHAHRCSIGEPGGFLTRLRRGTYAAHIVEHVAIELQTMIGHDVSYGRTRGGDTRGEYTIAFEHLHEAVGRRAGVLALEIVQRAFAGTLGPVDGAVAELRAIAQTPNVPPVQRHVLCGITGGAHRAETRDALAQRGYGADGTVVDVPPACLLQAGLPYSRSDLSIILDTELPDVPARYQDAERASRLVAVLADVVVPAGVVVCPATAWDVQHRARDAGCRVAIFATGPDVAQRERNVACAVALVDGGRIVIEHLDTRTDAGPLHDGVPVAAQIAAALAAFCIEERSPTPPTGHAVTS